MTQSPNGSANAKTDVGKDPAKAADVFEVPNDQLGSMAEAGYINPLSPDATKAVKNNNVAVASEGGNVERQDVCLSVCGTGPDDLL